MSIKITTLIENSQGEHKGLKIEHGLSFLIETAYTTILFDTGSSNGFIENAQKLSVNLQKVKHVVLSHGHYDHTGGFRFFTQIRPQSDYTLWTGPGFFAKKYGRFGPSRQYLGNDFDESFITGAGILHQTAVPGKTEIAPGIWIVAGFGQTHPEEKRNPRFILRDDTTETEVTDDFRDEILITLQCKKGLVVLVGCSHPGILNMLDTVKSLFKEPVFALLGGTHLVEADTERIEKAADTFVNAHIGLLGVSHCTGEQAVSVLEQKSENTFRNCTGSTLFIEE